MLKELASPVLLCAIACSSATPQPYSGEAIEIGVQACLDYLNPNMDEDEVTRLLSATDWTPRSPRAESIDGKRGEGFEHERLSLTYLRMTKPVDGSDLDQSHISCTISGQTDSFAQAQELASKANGIAQLPPIGSSARSGYASKGKDNLDFAQIRANQLREKFYFEAQFVRSSRRSTGL